MTERHGRCQHDLCVTNTRNQKQIISQLDYGCVKNEYTASTDMTSPSPMPRGRKRGLQLRNR